MSLFCFSICWHAACMVWCVLLLEVGLKPPVLQPTTWFMWSFPPTQAVSGMNSQMVSLVTAGQVWLGVPQMCWTLCFPFSFLPSPHFWSPDGVIRHFNIQLSTTTVIDGDLNGDQTWWRWASMIMMNRRHFFLFGQCWFQTGVIHDRHLDSPDRRTDRPTTSHPPHTHRLFWSFHVSLR